MTDPNPQTCRISPDVRLGQDVLIRDFVNLYGCEVGDNSRIGTFVEIQKGATIGRNCKIQSHTFICEGVTIEDNVFIGHNVTFINDRFPRAVREDGQLQGEQDWVCIPTLIRSRGVHRIQRHDPVRRDDRRKRPHRGRQRGGQGRSRRRRRRGQSRPHAANDELTERGIDWNVGTRSGCSPLHATIPPSSIDSTEDSHDACSTSRSESTVRIHPRGRRIRPAAGAGQHRLCRRPFRRRLRKGVRRVLRVRVRRRGQQRHLRPVAVPAGPRHRPRRRGHHDAEHVHRHGRGHQVLRRQARLRGRRSGHVHDGPGPSGGGHHAADQGHHSRSISTGSRRTWTRSWRSPDATACT